MKKKSYGNAFIVSCTLHLVGLLLGTLYVVKNEIYENDPIQIIFCTTFQSFLKYFAICLQIEYETSKNTSRLWEFQGQNWTNKKS